jgi:hypothetical protein
MGVLRVMLPLLMGPLVVLPGPCLLLALAMTAGLSAPVP